ncbi:hypothetical protein PUN28_020154 [Cardiocondyla obscurior]|uniref:Uncharacterized protein n=1 Tax=Cardiocondyla obscurior TaxID=286306 RepID=A0AAW2E9N0_9HYME
MSHRVETKRRTGKISYRINALLTAIGPIFCQMSFEQLADRVVFSRTS